jgi:hypothetical protein
MAALLAIHGLSTPGVLVGPNGLISLSGAATLPVGGAMIALASLSHFSSPRTIPRIIGVQIVLAVTIVSLALAGTLAPALVPPVPQPRSPVALAVFAIGLVLYAALAVRAARTFLLTRRLADLAVVLGSCCSPARSTARSSSPS